MATIPQKVSERLASALKRFQPIISSARARDVNESDTVTIVTDILAELFGYDKYNEITKEYAIRGTYCDLAIELDGRPQLLIEVKAIGLDLKDPHVKQVVDYAANKGVEWVVLTNGMTWRIYRVIFAKPIDHEVITEINLLEINPKNSGQIEQLFLIAREAWAKSTLSMYYTQLQATNKFTLAAVLLTEPVIDIMRRELRRYNPDVRVQPEEIREVLLKDVLKREVVEGEKADEASKKIEKMGRTALRQVSVKPKAEAKPDSNIISETEDRNEASADPASTDIQATE
ncbi:MAG: restriction endonuclease subunit R [Chlorobi bacterium CHB2]|nr:restriction endonuclease subunit R [Chlorobi bacterium CHB2]